MDTLERIVSRFTRALDSYDAEAVAQRQICRRLIALLRRYTGCRFRRVLEIGCGTGGFTRLLTESCAADEWTLNDICEGCRERVAGLFAEAQPVFIAGDAEQAAFTGRFDLIASASAFQWIQHQEMFLHRMATYLSPGGTLLFNTFAPDNLHEVRSLTGKGLDYPDAERITEWMAADYRVVHTEEERIVLTFDTPMDVLRHLKNTGVTATGGGQWTRSRQADFCRRYTEMFSTSDDKVTLTYCPLYIVAEGKNK